MAKKKKGGHKKGGSHRSHKKNPGRRRRRRNPGMPNWLKGGLIASGFALGASVVALGGEYLIANVIKPATPMTSAITYGVTGILLALGFGFVPHGVPAGVVVGTTFVASALATLASQPKPPPAPAPATQGLGAGLSRDLLSGARVLNPPGMGRVIANDMGRVIANNMAGLTANEIAHLKDHGRRLGLSDSQIGTLITMHAAA